MVVVVHGDGRSDTDSGIYSSSRSSSSSSSSSSNRCIIVCITTGLYNNYPDTVLPVHILSNHEATAKSTTQDGGNFG